MKLILSEKQILTNIRLSGVQKTLLAKIVAAPTPQLAYDQVSDGRNFVATRDILQKLRLIDIPEEGIAAITDEGKRVMQDENLMDPSGELTSEGQQYIEAKNANEIDKPVSGQADADASTQPGAEDGMGFGDELGGDELGGGADLNMDDMGTGEQGSEDDLLSDENNPTKKKAFESLLQSVNSNIGNLVESVEPVTFNLREICQIESGKDLSDNLLNKIQDFVVEYDANWMPPHVQKARLRDPHNWIMDRLDQIIPIINQSASK